MKSTLIVLFASCLVVFAETGEQLNKRFTVQPGGKLVVDVDFGSINVNTNASNEVTVDVLRKVTRSTKADEEAFLRDHPVAFSQDGNTVTISSRSKTRFSGWWHGFQKTEGKYIITVPAPFNAQLKTSGGAVTANDLTGEVKAETSGGGFRFARLHGTLNAETSGGGIHVTDCEGPLKVRTSGGGIDISGGSGSLDGETSGGPVTVKEFRGPALVESSGGGITIENVAGKVEGSTSGGSISAQFSAPLSEEVKLETSGGGVTLRVPENSAFNLDASTSGGSVNSELPVSVVGKVAHSHLKGPVNGGGKPVVLRTSGGSIHVRKS
jgi:putative adhesin